jgi:PKD repeat protein
MIQKSRTVARLGASIAVFGGVLFAAFNANAQSGNRPEVPPGLALGANSRGEEALQRLGKDLPAVAAAYDMDAPALQALLRNDRDLWVDSAGHLLYVCEGLIVEEGLGADILAEGAVSEDATTADGEVEASTAVLTSTDAFNLHSRAGSSRTIYLDFTGHTTSGTSWNSSYNGGKSIVSAPFDMDGSPSTFSSTERDRIKKIWQRVAEDFSEFAVNVTTKDPGLEALRRTSSTDSAYGVRAVITPSSGWYPNAGGVAYIGSFKAGSDTPCFVFSNMLGPNGEKYVAECISHEVGHTLGLNHDGKTDGTSYYQGHGSWAPIMGSGYYKAITQWSKGEYSGANNKQDDLAVMPTYGASIAPDDHGNSTSTATAFASGTSVADLGVIETRADVDYFRFSTGAGLVSFNLTGTSPQSNCDLKLELLNSSGSVMTSVNALGLNASLGLTLTKGTYYLRISGIGSGDPLSTGYSDYASIGEYLITGTIVSLTSTTNTAPVAVASATPTSGGAPLAVGFSSSGSYDPDGSISSRKWTFGDGTTSTSANPSKTYNSAGTYTATLVVTDNLGKVSATKSLTITAGQISTTGNKAPIAKGSATPTSGKAPLTVKFSCWGSYDPDGSIASYKWTFGDGTSSTAQNPSKTYNTTGSYTAKLTVTDTKGATGSKSFLISVGTTTTTSNNSAPLAKGSATPTSGSSPLAVKFSSWGSWDPDGWISSYKWLFGDGTSSTAQHPSHTYKSAGSFTAKLIVTDKAGATGSKSFAISAK